MSKVIKTRKPLAKYVHDDFLYEIDRPSKDKRLLFWRCIHRKANIATGRLGCCARIHTTSDGSRTFVRMLSEHSCSYTGTLTSANGPYKADGEAAKKRTLGEAQKSIPWQTHAAKSDDQHLAFVVSTYATSMRSVDDLFELVQGNVGDEPIDFTDVDKLQHQIFIREMARKMEKLSLDFERMDCSECYRCGKQIEKIWTENLAVEEQRNGETATSRDWHRIVQTTNRDLECASLAIHTFLYHPSELGPTLRCLFGSEIDAPYCYPYLDFQKSTPDLFVCFICKRKYADLMNFLRHAEMYHEATNI